MPGFDISCSAASSEESSNDALSYWFIIDFHRDDLIGLFGSMHERRVAKPNTQQSMTSIEEEGGVRPNSSNKFLVAGSAVVVGLFAFMLWWCEAEGTIHIVIPRG